MTVSWTILMNCLNTLSILQRCEDTLDAKGTQFAIYAKLCMETAQEQISFAVHQNLCKFLNIYIFFKYDHHKHHFIGKRPIVWKQVGDRKFSKLIFLTRFRFVFTEK